MHIKYLSLVKCQQNNETKGSEKGGRISKLCTSSKIIHVIDSRKIIRLVCTLKLKVLPIQMKCSTYIIKKMVIRIILDLDVHKTTNILGLHNII